MRKKVFSLLLLSICFIPVLADWADEEENGGVYQWAPIKPYRYDPFIHIKDLAVYDSLDAVALISRGEWGNLEIWKSTDGAQTWDVIYSELNSPSRFPMEIQHPSPNYIYACGHTNVQNILRSSDAGITWDTINTPELFFGGRLCMYDTLRGVFRRRFHPKGDIGYADSTIFLDELVYTEDGCETWTLIRPDTIINYAFGVRQIHMFSPDDMAIIHSKYGKHGKGPVFFRTKDRGKTWDVNYMASVTSANLKSMYFVNDSVGWIAAAKSTGEGHRDYDVLFKTTDGGKNWELNYKEK